jgi:hypothetical protein
MAKIMALKNNVENFFKTLSSRRSGARGGGGVSMVIEMA